MCVCEDNEVCVKAMSVLVGDTVGYATKNVIGSRTSFVIASFRSSIH